MIDLILEKNKSEILSAQDRYDIISFAMEAADDNGFINSFIFERALYVYAAIVLYPERKEEIAALAAEDLIGAWQELVMDGTIEDINEQQETIMNVLLREAEIWNDEYQAWAHSVRGILDVVQGFSDNLVQAAAGRLTETAEQTGVTDLLETAKDWGITRLEPGSIDPKTLLDKAE